MYTTPELLFLLNCSQLRDFLYLSMLQVFIETLAGNCKCRLSSCLQEDHPSGINRSSQTIRSTDSSVLGDHKGRVLNIGCAVLLECFLERVTLKLSLEEQTWYRGGCQVEGNRIHARRDQGAITEIQVIC